VDGAALVRAVHALALLASDKGRHGPTVPTELKMMLTIPEAGALSGMGRGAIEAAIKAGTLTAHKGPWRGRRVKRADLETYITKL